VIEGVPSVVGKSVTESLDIPLLELALAGHRRAGARLSRLLGLTNRQPAKFVRQYANLGPVITEAIRHFAEDVRSGTSE